MQLEILENKVRLVWGLGCFEIAAELLKVDTVEDVIFSVGNTANMVRVAYAAIQNGCEIDGNEVPFNIRQFQHWLDEQPADVGEKIVENFMNSTYQGKVMKQRYDEIIEVLRAANSGSGDSDGNGDKKKVAPKGRKSVK